MKPGRKSKFSDEQIATMITMAKSGSSQSAIARFIGCTQQTVGKYLQMHGVKGRRRKPDARSATHKPQTMEQRAAADAAAKRKVDALPRLPPGSPDCLVSVHDRVGQVSKLADKMYLGIHENETGLVPSFRELTKLEADLTAKVMAMTPPIPPDPELDPANLAARDRVRAKLKDIALTQRAKLCTGCLDRLGLTQPQEEGEA